MRKLLGALVLLAVLCLAGAALADVAIDKTIFPDANFRAYVKDSFDTDGNKVLDDDEIDAVRDISCGGQNIASLQGIEHFTKLELLYCFDNQLTALDLSRNKKLTELSCFGNQLTALDLSRNTALETLFCNGNQLTALDVTRNTKLITLSCSSNQLTALDVSKNTELIALTCDNNQLTELDVSRNTVLTTLYCDNNQLTELEVTRNRNMKYIGCSGNQLTELDVSKAPALMELYCDNNRITSLDTGKNPGLLMLLCGGNRLSKLNVSGNTELLELHCGGNRLTSLTLPAAPYLYLLDVSANALKKLDIAGTPMLRDAVEAGKPTPGDFREEGYSLIWSMETATEYIVLTADGNITLTSGDKTLAEPAETFDFQRGGLVYRLNSAKKTATVTGATDKKAKELLIEDTLTVFDRTYKVTAIKASAFKGMKKLASVVVGKYVKTIGKSAFSKCAKLKTITIKTTKLTTKTVGANAFKGVYRKATVKVPAKKLKAYKTLLVKKGLPKTAKIKK